MTGGDRARRGRLGLITGGASFRCFRLVGRGIWSAWTGTTTFK